MTASRSQSPSTLIDITSSTSTRVGIAVLAVVAVCAPLAPLIAPYDRNDQDILNSLAPPLARGAEGGLHLLGTDRVGQDITSRIIYGTRVSLIVAFGAAGSSALIGVPLGLAAGFLGRLIGSVVPVLADIILSIPFMLLALVVMSVLGSQPAEPGDHLRHGALGAERMKLVGDIIARLHDEAICAPMFAYQFIYAAAPGIKWQPRADEVISVSEIG